MKRTLKHLAVVILAASPVFQPCAHANNSSWDYFIALADNLSVEEAGTDREIKLEKPVMLTGQTRQAATASALVNTGISAWNVVSGGAPSGAASSAYASALPPAFYLTWNTVAKWKGPKEYIYTYTVTNLMGIDVIKAKYMVSFYYGGTEDYAGREADPKDVTGKYLTNFTVKALSVNVKWGWHFNLDAKISNPMNIGTIKKPVAFLQSDLQWTVSNVLSTSGGIWSYTVDGNGNFRDLAAEARELTKKIQPPASLENASIDWSR